MPDNFAHQHNARVALEISGYTPRLIDCFIMGANGPDLLFYYQRYNPLRKYQLDKLGKLMHREKTGLFLKNLFTMAATDAQKDYCLGFLCHYAMDSIIHPYVNYATTAYGAPFNIPGGHAFFESRLDSRIAYKTAADLKHAPLLFCPVLKKSYVDQIAYLLKNAVDATYRGFDVPYSEYYQALRDFRFAKKFFYSGGKFKYAVSYIAEKFLGVPDGVMTGHMQPCDRPIPPTKFWYNKEAGLYSNENLRHLLARADQAAADNIKVGLEFFKGVYSADDLLEDIGNKSYVTGVAVD